MPKVLVILFFNYGKTRFVYLARDTIYLTDTLKDKAADDTARRQLNADTYELIREMQRFPAIPLSGGGAAVEMSQMLETRASELSTNERLQPLQKIPAPGGGEQVTGSHLFRTEMHELPANECVLNADGNPYIMFDTPKLDATNTAYSVNFRAVPGIYFWNADSKKVKCKYNFPKGGMEGKETPEAAAVREVREETHYEILEERLVPLVKMAEPETYVFAYQFLTPDELLTFIRRNATRELHHSGENCKGIWVSTEYLTRMRSNLEPFFEEKRYVQKDSRGRPLYIDKVPQYDKDRAVAGGVVYQPLGAFNSRLGFPEVEIDISDPRFCFRPSASDFGLDGEGLYSVDIERVEPIEGWEQITFGVAPPIDSVALDSGHVTTTESAASAVAIEYEVEGIITRNGYQMVAQFSGKHTDKIRGYKKWYDRSNDNTYADVDIPDVMSGMRVGIKDGKIYYISDNTMVPKTKQNQGTQKYGRGGSKKTRKGSKKTKKMRYVRKRKTVKRK
jgi:ADP-ribose pyrophosphatase YjhB (NUDIX family)